MTRLTPDTPAESAAATAVVALLQEGGRVPYARIQATVAEHIRGTVRARHFLNLLRYKLKPCGLKTAGRGHARHAWWSLDAPPSDADLDLAGARARATWLARTAQGGLLQAVAADALTAYALLESREA